MLVEATALWPREGELQFLLGACEQALGRPEAAEAAWSRVANTSPFAGHAAMLRVRLLLKRERFAEAEDLLQIGLRASGQHAIEARETLVHLFKLEGRFDETRTLIEDGWQTLPGPFRAPPATGQSRLDHSCTDRKDLASSGQCGREVSG